MATPRTIVVAGAGIGGLTTALALTAKGFRVLIIEKAEKLEEAGAGIQLSPNASCILIDLGLEPLLAPHAIALDAISMMSAPSGRELTRIPLGDAAAFRHGAPYWIVHRADLQAALLAKVNDNPDIELRLGVQFDDVASHAKGVTVVLRRDMTRHQETALALIGADGLWSAVRNHLFPDVRPTFSGRIAWRGMIETSQVPREFRERRVQLWMGRNAHLVAYPVSGGRRVNLVAIVEGEWNRPGWSEPGAAAEIKAHFDAPKWPGAARLMVSAAENWRRWALYSLKDGGVWTSGNVALLGDAAHAMLPFMAQGAGMAIEDADTIAHCLAQSPGDVAGAFSRYAGQRQGRVARVQRAARMIGHIYHLGGPLAAARDAGIRLIGGERLLAQQDWIFDRRSG